MRRALISMLGLLCCAASGAAVQKTAIQLHDDVGPYFRLNLPQAIYGAAKYGDLRDIRIRNATGDFLAYAWGDSEVKEGALTSGAVSFFPVADIQKNSVLTIKANADGSLSAVSTQTEHAQNAVPAWIIDVSQITGNLLQARFALASDADGIFAFSLESSDDLHQWQLVSGSEQLVQLRHQGTALSKLEVPLNQIHTRYLRLRWSRPAQAPRIDGIWVDSVQQTEATTPLEWSAPLHAANCTADVCDYNLPARTPLDGLRIQLSEVNALASVRILGVLPTAHYVNELHHNPLYLLRHQKRLAAGEVPTELVLAEPVVYRLSLPEGEATSADLTLDGGTYTRLRLQSKSPIYALGKLPPTIQIATLPRKLVFLAHGPAPYFLEWGIDQQGGEPLPLSVLLPEDTHHQLLHAAAKASVLIPVAAPIDSVQQVAQKKAAETVTNGGHRNWLWAALALVLALLGSMVWTLLKGLPEKN
ncbi:MAG: DUF3999 family protein [Burkholderiales bacterium]|nr:DUF3999 family protein [Burkholderiales bacterium]